VSTAHTLVARACLIHVSFSAFNEGLCVDDEQLETRLHEYPLYQYAAQHWGIHARDGKTALSEINELALNFIQNHAKVQASIQVMELPSYRCHGYSQHYTKNVSGLQIDTSFGLCNVVQGLIDRGANATSKDDSGRTALHRAAENGHEAVASILLLHQTTVDAIENRNGHTLLHLAVLNGHNVIVERLLTASALTNVRP